MQLERSMRIDTFAAWIPALWNGSTVEEKKQNE